MGHMSRMAQFLRGRVAFAIVGAVLFGGVSAALVVMPSTYSGINGLFTRQATATSSSGDLAGDATATPEGTTPARPTATRTPAPLGSAANPLRGTVVSVTITTTTTTPNYFTIRSGGQYFTIDVNASTTYGGLAHSLAELQSQQQATPLPTPTPTPRLRASVVGTQESTTRYLASHVDASRDE